MDGTTIIIIALGLSMDSFSVSVALGCRPNNHIYRKRWLVAGIFALFQGSMPLVGWWLGLYLQDMIYHIDHWIAFILLALIGIKMIIDSFKKKECTIVSSSLTLYTICGLALATSIDALAVGISFGFLGSRLIILIIMIALVTFVSVMIGIHFGKTIGVIFGKRMEAVGGLVLILIGFKILFEHLLKHI